MPRKPPARNKLTSRSYRNSPKAARRATRSGKPEDFFTVGKRGANSKGLPKTRRAGRTVTGGSRRRAK